MRRTARRTSRRTARRVERRNEATYEEPAYEEPASAEPAAAGPADDVYADFKKIADLHEQGILTDEEYAIKKAELLEEL